MTTQLWLQQKISEESGIDSSQIGFDQEFEQFRMDSLSVITLAYELEAFSELIRLTLPYLQNLIPSINWQNGYRHRKNNLEPVHKGLF